MLFPFLAQDIDIDHLAIDQLEIIDADDGLDGGHLFGLQLLVNLFRDKEHTAFGMGCNLLDVVRGELMQKGNSHSTISSDCKEANSPMAAVLTTKGNLVARLDTEVTEQDVKRFNPLGSLAILELDARIVGKRSQLPMLRKRVTQIRGVGFVHSKKDNKTWQR